MDVHVYIFLNEELKTKCRVLCQLILNNFFIGCKTISCLVHSFLDNGQIEIVSGGWVMSDEANSHYYSMIQELTHGHQWLQEHLNYQPR